MLSDKHRPQEEAGKKQKSCYSSFRARWSVWKLSTESVEIFLIYRFLKFR